MADTIRTRGALQTLLADNAGGDISAQDVRDFLVSTYNWVNATIGGNIYYTEGDVGVGCTPVKRFHVYSADIDKTIATLKGSIADNGDWIGLGFGYTARDIYEKAGIAFERTGNYAIGTLHFLLNGDGDDSNVDLTDSKMSLDYSGNLTISGTVDVSGDSVRIRTSQSPASNGAGAQGEIAWDGTNFYVCVSTNTWGKVALTLAY